MAINQQDLALIAAPITKEHYPKTFDLWGSEWIDRINKLSVQAALLVDRRVDGDNVAYVGLSEDKSKAKAKPVVFVDTEGFKRYYISERHVKQSKLPKPVQV
ncbi:hypothetical protein [Psychrobacter pygoscelis]|uniref:hypothetical protein n=1 Tax=Psychrobacter pygoscelis TaxID=2488563 RepID=UPI00103A5E45|nr:hypothetical protein [Psychrobacter pygoscelis]